MYFRRPQSAPLTKPESKRLPSSLTTILQTSTNKTTIAAGEVAAAPVQPNVTSRTEGDATSTRPLQSSTTKETTSLEVFLRGVKMSCQQTRELVETESTFHDQVRTAHRSRNELHHHHNATTNRGGSSSRLTGAYRPDSLSLNASTSDLPRFTGIDTNVSEAGGAAAMMERSQTSEGVSGGGSGAAGCGGGAGANIPKFTPVYAAIPRIAFGGSSVLSQSALPEMVAAASPMVGTNASSNHKLPPFIQAVAAPPQHSPTADTGNSGTMMFNGNGHLTVVGPLKLVERFPPPPPQEGEQPQTLATGMISPRLGGSSESYHRQEGVEGNRRTVRFDIPEQSASEKRRAYKKNKSANSETEHSADGDDSEQFDDDESGTSGASTSRKSSLLSSQIGGGVLRRHLGLPPSISRPLEYQISNDADYTFSQIFNALGIRPEGGDREMNKAVSVLRMTNESIQSTRNMKQQHQHNNRSVDEQQRATNGEEEVDCHWFAARNIVVERVAGVSNDAFSLAECSLAGASETDLLQWQAFAGQARRGFPTGGFTPGEQHPFSMIFEPMIPFSEYEGVGHDTATRIKSNVRVLLVGTAHRSSTTGQRRLIGHQCASDATRRLLLQDNECVYHARIEAERQHRKAARARRDAERGINPFYIRTKPVGTAAIQNSLLQHSSDELMVSAGYWLGDSALGGGGPPSATPTPEGDQGGATPTSANITLDEANLQRLRADISKTTFGPTMTSSPSGTRVRSTKRVFPPALTQLLLEKQRVAMQPLRQQKPVKGVRALPNFISHEELRCVPEFMVVYEESEPALELGQLLVEVDELILKGPPGQEGRPHSASVAKGAKPASSSESVRRKQLDPARATVLVRELRKAPPKPLSVIEFTTRWGGPIEAVATRAVRDVSVRKWFQFPSPAELAAHKQQQGTPATTTPAAATAMSDSINASSGSSGGGNSGAVGIPLTQLLEVCRHGSVSIDVKNRNEDICFRHSFVFGSSSGLH